MIEKRDKVKQAVLYIYIYLQYCAAEEVAANLVVFTASSSPLQ
jgi:hypothetical protein